MDYEKKIREYMASDEVDQLYKSMLSNLFPELKEGEDEVIRKKLIKFFSKTPNAYYPVIGLCSKDALAWLEKQGEQKPTAEEVLIKAGLKPYKDGNQWCVLVGDNIQEGICGFGDTIEDALYEFLKEVCGNFEQKPANKPKFKVGDWVVDTTFEKENYIGEVGQIKSVNLEGVYPGYIIEGINCYLNDGNIIGEYYLRPWSIQDAKKGDVLVHSECIFIFMGLKDGIVQGVNENFQKPVNFGDPDIDDDYYPASEVQRDLLFQKIHEAGYEWDIENKKLKKIEQKPVDIEIPFGASDSELVEATYYIPQGFHAEIEGNRVVVKKGEQKPAEWSEEDEKELERILKVLHGNSYHSFDEWLNSLKDRVTLQPKQEWNEEDEGILNWCLLHFSGCIDVIEHNDEYKKYLEEKIIPWLKSLRPQKQWKPTEEMLDALKWATNCPAAINHAVLAELYEQIKVL